MRDIHNFFNVPYLFWILEKLKTSYTHRYLIMNIIHYYLKNQNLLAIIIISTDLITLCYNDNLRLFDIYVLYLEFSTI